jgi:hypothetical protein
VDATTGAGWTTAAERATGVELVTSRPELHARYLRALPDARAAVLARLWGALAREPIAGINGRTRDGGDLVVTLTGGRRLRGPAGAAEPFAEVPDGLTLNLDGVPIGHPAALARILAPNRPEHDDPPHHADRPDHSDRPHHTDRGGRLAAELDNSVANLALARAAQPPPDGGPPMLARLAGDGPAGGDPVLAEQLVVDGHPLHPGCRTRLGLSPAEVLAYAPEHRRTVDLAVVAVPASRWISTGTGLPPLLLVHPWQRDHILPRYPRLRATGRTVAARPLMSLRTLAPVHEPGWHVKTAVDVQMTSAVRTVSAAAIHNGPLLSALVDRAAAGRLELLAEVAGGAVLVDGQPCRSLAMVRRRAPRVAAGEVVVPFAALAARSAADGRPLVTEAVALGYPGRPAQLFTDVVNLLFGPLTALLHLGVALEAHGQNMGVALRAGRPVRLLYRDFGGVRVSPRRLAAGGLEVPPLRGDLVCDDPDVLRTKLIAAMLSTVVGELVAVLVRVYDLDPARLWRIADRALADSYRALPTAARGDEVALRTGAWPVKATTAMRLADDPVADLWTCRDNPLVA